MKKILILLFLGSFSIQLSAMGNDGDRPVKKQKTTVKQDSEAESKEDFDENFIYGSAGSFSVRFASLDQELFDSVQNHDIEGVKKALKKGAYINLKDEDDSPLIIEATQIALERHDLKIVEILLNWPNLNVNAKDNDGWTALHIAVAARIEAETLPDEEDYSLDTGLPHYPELVDLLIKNGADTKIKTYNGDTPLILAFDSLRFKSNIINDNEEDAFFKVIKLLANHENINIPNKEEFTSLLLAIDTEGMYSTEEYILCLEIVKYFVNELNALITIKDFEGRTSIDIAKNYDHKSVKEFLENKLKERIKDVQQKVKKEILDSTPLPDVLANLTSEYLESETTQII